MCHGLGSGGPQLREPGGGLGQQEKQGAIAGEDERRRADHHRNNFLCSCSLWRMGCLWCKPWAEKRLLCRLSATGHLLHGLQVVGANTTVITDSRGGCGPPPLGVCEQVPPEAQVTSESGIEEGSATEHHPLLLSLPWECTRPAAATAKPSGCCLYLPGGSLPLCRALQLGRACATSPWVLAT